MAYSKFGPPMSADRQYSHLKESSGAINPMILADEAAGLVGVGDLLMTAAYVAGSDVGGGLYEAVAGGTGTDDGGSFIDLETLQLRGIFGDEIPVARFGPSDAMAVAANALTNDPLAKANAFAATRPQAGTLVLQSGVTVTAGIELGQLAVTTPGDYQNPTVSVVGPGADRCEIFVANGANAPAIKSPRFDALTGTNAWFTNEGVPYGFKLDGFTVNGNKSNNFGVSSKGIALYAKAYVIGKVVVRDCRNVGFYSECAAKTGQSDYTDLPEAEINNLIVRACQNDGFIFRGPHNTSIERVLSAFNSGWGARFEYVADTYDGNADEIQSIHTYCNDGNQGLYVGALVRFGQIIMDGDNMIWASSGSKGAADSITLFNSGGNTDGLLIEANAVRIGELRGAAIAPTDGATKYAMVRIVGNENTIGSAFVGGNNLLVDGFVVEGRDNEVGPAFLDGCNGVGYQDTGTRNIGRVRSAGCGEGVEYATATSPEVYATIRFDAGQAQIVSSTTPSGSDRVLIRHTPGSGAVTAETIWPVEGSAGALVSYKHASGTTDTFSSGDVVVFWSQIERNNSAGSISLNGTSDAIVLAADTGWYKVSINIDTEAPAAGDATTMAMRVNGADWAYGDVTLDNNQLMQWMVTIDTTGLAHSIEVVRDLVTGTGRLDVQAIVEQI